MNLLYPDGKIRNRAEDSVWKRFGAHADETAPSETQKKIAALKLMTQDPASGTGHYLFLPKGALIFNLLKAYLYALYAEFGCFYLESPILTDYEHPAVKNHADLSGEQTYHTKSAGRHLITKIGALYSQLELVGQGGLPARTLPLKLFEMTKCCRIEKRVSPLGRSNEFTMVDMHELCADLSQACDEGLAVHRRILELGREFGMDFYSTFTVTDEFLSTHPDYLTRLVRIQEREGMLQPADPEKGRPLNLEYHVDTGEGAPLEIAALQIDASNPKSFGIRNEDGSWPVLIHANIVGSVERFMYALLVKAVKKGSYPLWLAPEQIRLIPSAPEKTASCMALAGELRGSSLRVTVDDRQKMQTADKAEAARKDMVPKVIVMDGNGPAALDDTDNHRPVSVKELSDDIASRMKGKPRMGAAYPVNLSCWPDYF